MGKRQDVACRLFWNIKLRCWVFGFGAIRYKLMLGIYLMFLLVMVVVPLGQMNATLSNTSVFELRLDYLVHVLMFAPVVVLWRLGFPGQAMWKIAGVGGVAGCGAGRGAVWVALSELECE